MQTIDARPVGIKNENIPVIVTAGLMAVAVTALLFDFLDDREPNGSILPGRSSEKLSENTKTELIPEIPENTIINMEEAGQTLGGIVDDLGGPDHVDIIDVFDEEAMEQVEKYLRGECDFEDLDDPAQALVEKIAEIHEEGRAAVLYQESTGQVMVVHVPLERAH